MTGSSDHSTPATLTVNLLVDKSANKVLYAEAPKQFVDFLFSLLMVPVGTAVQIFTAPDTVGAVENIYSSVESMRSDYLQPNLKKEVLLNPKIAAGEIQLAGLLPLPCQPAPPEAPIRKRYYGCEYSTGLYGNSSCAKYFTETTLTACPECNRQMNRELVQVTVGVAADKKADVADVPPRGYVQELVTYMVKDDLSVIPMSGISCITLLNKFHVNDLRSLEERTVSIGMEEAR